MSMLGTSNPKYEDGRTKQAFADSCDINKILKKAQKTGSIAHVQKYPAAVYADFHGYDLLEAYEMANRAKEIFADLPSEIRREFNGDAFSFAAFASDPTNAVRLSELLPAIAEPGRYFPNPVKRAGEGAGEATPPADAPAAGDSPTPATEPPAAAPAAPAADASSST